MKNKAFDGIRVIECATSVGVAYAGKLLADLGAEVIKIEAPKVGDPNRHRAPFAGEEEGTESSLLFLYLNTNKKSLTLDLESVDGTKILKDLLKDADIFLREGLPEGYEKKGLGYEELSQSNPGLVLSSNTPFGEWGPYKNYAATPFVLAHMTGNTSLYPHGTGDEEKAPVILGGNFEEYDTGVAIFSGIVGTLIWRERSGRGQYIENSSLEARLMVLPSENSIYPLFGMNFNRSGATQRLNASLAFRSKDGWLCPFLTTPRDFTNIAKIIGKEEWLEEEWYNDIPQRREKCDVIAEAIHAWAKDYTTEEAVAICQAQRVPIGPVATIEDVVESEQYEVRGFFTELDHPVVGLIKFPGRPANMSITPFSYDRAAPLLGQDSVDILTTQLGFDNQQIEQLSAAGTI